MDAKLVRPRAAPRRSVLKGAYLVWDNSPAYACLVRNISDTGACLQVNDPVPNGFTLILNDIRRACRVVWRKQNRIGIEFIT